MRSNRPGPDYRSRHPGVFSGQPRTKLDLLRELFTQESTVEQLVEATGVDRTVVRRHMADLLSTGLVVAQPVRGSRGRPRLRYAITAEGREVFYARYDALLDVLTRAASRRFGARQAYLLFQEAAKSFAEDLHFPASRAATLLAFREFGFEPELRTERGRRLIISRNCPVLRQAQKSPRLVCQAFHAGLLDRAFVGSKARLRQTMATGAPECIHVMNVRSGENLPEDPLAPGVAK